MTIRLVCAISAAGILGSSIAFAEGVLGTLQVGPWTGGAYTNDATGAFAYCAASTTHQSGTRLAVNFTPLGKWSLAFFNPSWQMPAGDEIEIDLTFNDQTQFHVFGGVISPALVLVGMPSNSSLIAEFRKSTNMAATVNGQSFQFNLNATAQLLPALSNCVNQHRTGATALTRQQNRQSAQGPAVATKTDRPVAGSTTSADLQIEAIELATNFLLKAQLHNSKVLTRSETPVELASSGAAWTSDEAAGTVTILLPQGNVKGLDVAAAVAGRDARECKAKFASGRVSELVDSDVIFRGFSTCEDSAGSRVAQYFIIPRGRGGFVIFSLVSNMGSEGSRRITRDDRLNDFRKAALTVVPP